MLTKLQPSVMHVTAGLVESRDEAGLLIREGLSGSSQMAITDKYSDYDQQILSPRGLGRMLSKARATPLVILDIPAPPVERELVNQLRLRNLFAADLAECEPLPAILATGLAVGTQRLTLLETLTELLIRERPIGEIHRAIPEHLHTSDEKSVGPAIARLGAALFTSNPGQCFRLTAVPPQRRA